MIIADLDRHAASYAALSAIAPTLLLPSRGEDYAGSLKSAKLIGKAVGKSAEMDARLAQHDAVMKDYRTKIHALAPAGTTVIFGAAREDSLSLHGPDSYDGSVLESLGLSVPSVRKNGEATDFVSIEQLLAIDPNYLFVGHYRRPSIVDKWSKEDLWTTLKAAQTDNHIVSVDSNVWARNRGIMAAERIADDTLHIFQGNFKQAE